LNYLLIFGTSVTAYNNRLTECWNLLAACAINHLFCSERAVVGMCSETVSRLFVEMKKMNIYVGNLSYEVQDGDLQQAFGAFGSVRSAKVITDMATGRSKGFGFVEMESKDDAQSAITSLNGTELLGRSITVNEARPRAERGGFSGGAGGGGARRDRW
jgi:cold-inducible RNA-binding protein